MEVGFLGALILIGVVMHANRNYRAENEIRKILVTSAVLIIIIGVPLWCFVMNDETKIMQVGGDDE